MAREGIVARRRGEGRPGRSLALGWLDAGREYLGPETEPTGGLDATVAGIQRLSCGEADAAVRGDGEPICLHALGQLGW